MQANPRIVFFTGGTALRDVSRALADITDNTCHIVTAFDSGGSTAALRHSFAMPAVGDIRNRTLALADPASVPQPALNACLRRLPSHGDFAQMRAEIRAGISSGHEMWHDVPESFGKPLRAMLEAFVRRMPADFDPRCAIFGNLMLAGLYFEHNRSLADALEIWSKLFAVRGMVLPVTEESFHLAAHLANGDDLVGQHRFCRLESPVTRLFLTPWQKECIKPCAEMYPDADSRVLECIAGAGALCYPMGSFYTSVVANLLPHGVARAIAAVQCPKMYIANSGHDAEQCGHSVADRVKVILETLRRDAPDAPASALLHTVLVDTKNGIYSCGIDIDGIEAQGVEVLDLPLVGSDPRRHDPNLTAEAILRCARAEKP